MMPGGRRGLVAPQNTFLDSLIKKAAAQAGDIGNIFMHITMVEIIIFNDEFSNFSVKLQEYY